MHGVHVNAGVAVDVPLDSVCEVKTWQFDTCTYTNMFRRGDRRRPAVYVGARGQRAVGGGTLGRGGLWRLHRAE